VRRPAARLRRGHLATQAEQLEERVRQEGRVPRRRRHQARQAAVTTKEEQQAENFRKMLVAMARDIRVILVKLCDRLDNMRTLEHMKPEKQERIAAETMQIYAPLANRLGIARVKSELEDLSFKYLHPGEYEQLAEKVQKTRAERAEYIPRSRS
jgi:(p)ppGpp synthase/HD superfamily hydrolase